MSSFISNSLRELNEMFNDDINNDLYHVVGVSKKPVDKRNIERFIDDIMEDMYGNDNIIETLDKQSSLNYHYNKHVLKQNEVRTSKNRNKYDYMTKKEYFDYALYISTLVPDYLIDINTTNEDRIDLVDDFQASGGILKIDCDLKNKRTGKLMYALFNSKSNYSKYMEICLIDSITNIPISIFVLTGGRFTKYMHDFLGL